MLKRTTIKMMYATVLMLASSGQHAAFPATFRFRGLHRNGSVLQLETDMIPLTFGGHTIAYHFVRLVGA